MLKAVGTLGLPRVRINNRYTTIINQLIHGVGRVISYVSKKKLVTVYDDLEIHAKLTATGYLAPDRQKDKILNPNS